MEGQTSKGYSDEKEIDFDSYFEQSMEADDFVEEKIQDPEVGMCFDSIDDLMKYYTKYGNEKGFPVKKRSSSRGIDGEVRWVSMACSRSGQAKSKSKNSFKMNPSCKTNCDARIRAVLYPDEKWRVTTVFLEHNHALSPGKSRYYRKNRVMRPYVRRRLEINDKAGIRPNKNFSSFVVEAGGHENLSFLEKDCYNYLNKVRRLRLGEGDAMALQSYFSKMQANNLSFFHEMDIDEKFRIKNVFWADARSRAAYEEFGDAITFDTTYLTNKYDMPFAPFVGVNHHGQSILLGCGLISSENTDAFTWLFQTWLTCMNGRAPAAIITDQDRAMKKAIEIVFPNTRHRWCIWHIMKKVPEKLRGYKEYESIKFAMQQSVYNSLTCEEFEEKWKNFIEKFNLEENDWLTGLYDERKRWVPAFVKDTFWAGMSSTQRSESMHAFFDGYVNSKTTLKLFVEQYENALRSKVQKENQSDFESFNSQIPCITRFGMEKQFQDAYTTSKFKEFQEEITGKLYCDVCSIIDHGGFQIYEVSEDLIGEMKRKVIFIVYFNQDDWEIKCTCRLFEFRGILCRHAITMLFQKKIDNIPEKYILRRWRKDVKRNYNKVKILYCDWSLNPEIERFDRMCNAFYQLGENAASNEEKTNLVIRNIKWLTNELQKGESACSSGYPTSLGTNEVRLSTSGEISPSGKKHHRICSPLAVRSKGRPPFKRNENKLEKIIKKKKEHKKKKTNKAKEKEISSTDHEQDGVTKNTQSRPLLLNVEEFGSNLSLSRVLNPTNVEKDFVNILIPQNIECFPIPGHQNIFHTTSSSPQMQGYQYPQWSGMYNIGINSSSTTQPLFGVNGASTTQPSFGIHCENLNID